MDTSHSTHLVNQFQLHEYTTLTPIEELPSRFHEVKASLCPKVSSYTSKQPEQEWANGLRGLAAFLVMTHHLIVSFNEHAALSTQDADGTVHFWQWPILRVFISPEFLVSIFFVLSGYVLSYRVLYRLNQGCVPSIIRDSLASASLRRIFRLLPLAAFSIIFSHIILLCGGYDLANSKKIGWWWIENCTPHWITTNWFSQTLEALKDIIKIWYYEKTGSMYNTALRTMTHELHGSLNVYLFLLATSALRKRYRNILAISLALVQVLVQEINTLHFFLGILIAELHVTYPNLLKANTKSRKHQFFRLPLIFTTLLAGLTCGSVPYWNMAWAPWYLEMYNLLSKFYNSDENSIKALYLVTGAALIVLVISQWSAAQQFLSVRPLKFLGKISFSLYVIHVPLLLSAGLNIFYQISQLGFSYTTSIALMVPLWMGLVIAMSCAMTRFVDEKAIEISQQLETIWSS